jgi:hypothetical protein
MNYKQLYQLIINSNMFDIESSIISRYQGEARLQRLLWVATEASPEVRQAALPLAKDYAQQLGNIRRFQETCHLLQQNDDAWVNHRMAQNRQDREILMQRLSVAQAHLNKEAIRVAYLALAEHDTQTGELREALYSAVRAKDYCTNRSHTAVVSLYVLQIALYQQNYKTVQDYSNKLQHILNQVETAVKYKVLIATGLERLAAHEYTLAANKFVEALYCAMEHNSVEGSEHLSWNDVLAPEDVALFAAFLSLAANTSRDSLIQLAEHPEALELIPIAREILLQFAQRANYKATWQLLEQHLFPALKLDLYLGLHFEALKQCIREKCLLQYWKSYDRVELSALAEHMGPGLVPPEQCTDLCVSLIRKRLFPTDTRINLQDSVLVRVPVESVMEKTQRRLNSATERTLDDTYAMMIRLACVEHNLVIVDPHGRKRRGGGWAGLAPAVGSVVFDEEKSDEEVEEPMEDDAMNPEDLY